MPALYPGERLVVCKNPLLAAERARKRADLLAATEAKLEQVAEAVRREWRPLRGEARIAVRADRALRSHKVGKRFVDHDPQAAACARSSPVAPARASPATRAKAAGRKRAPNGLPVHSLRTLLADLAILARNRVQPAGAAPTDVLTQSTPVQERALRLLGVKP